MNVNRPKNLKDAINQQDPFYVFYYSQNRKTRQLDEIADVLIKIGDPEWIYKFALTHYNIVDLKKIEDALINIAVTSRNDHTATQLNKHSPYEWLYLFAMDIEKANKKEIQKIICHAYDAKTIFYFAKDIPDVDKELLSKAVCKTKDGEYIFKFARNIKGLSDYSDLQEAVVKSHQYEYVVRYAKFVETADVPLMQKQMFESNYNIQDIIDFTEKFDLCFEYVENYLIKKFRHSYFEEYVLNEIVKLAKHPKADITKLATSLMNINVESFIKFAKKIPQAKLKEIKNLDAIEKTIINKYYSKENHLIFDYLKIKPDLRVSPELEEAIFNTKNTFATIYDYLMEHPNRKAAYENFVFNSKDEKFIFEYLHAQYHLSTTTLTKAEKVLLEDIEDKEQKKQILKRLKEIKILKEANNNLTSNQNILNLNEQPEQN